MFYAWFTPKTIIVYCCSNKMRFHICEGSSFLAQLYKQKTNTQTYTYVPGCSTLWGTDDDSFQWRLEKTDFISNFYVAKFQNCTHFICFQPNDFFDASKYILWKVLTLFYSLILWFNLWNVISGFVTGFTDLNPFRRKKLNSKFRKLSVLSTFQQIQHCLGLFRTFNEARISN